MLSDSFKRHLSWLLCFALLWQVAIPTGFMPDLNALGRGVYKIVICSGHGPQEIIADQPQAGDAGHQQDQGKKDHHNFCPFGAAPHAALMVLALVFAGFLLGRQDFSFVAAHRLAACPAGSAWPRGPPSL